MIARQYLTQPPPPTPPAAPNIVCLGADSRCILSLATRGPSPGQTSTGRHSFEIGNSRWTMIHSIKLFGLAAGLFRRIKEKVGLLAMISSDLETSV